MKNTIVTFIFPGGEFLSRAQRLETTLSGLGRIVSSNRGGGIAQFSVATKLSVEQVHEKIKTLRLGGTITCGEEENDEMEMA